MKSDSMGRRDFLKTTAAFTAMTAVAGAGFKVSAAESGSPLKKALQLGMLPKELSDADKFKLAKACGYEGIEAYPMEDLDAAKKLGDAAKAAGVRIHSLCYGGWGAPMSDPDPAVIEKGLKEIDNALRSAKAMGADAVLVVPAVVNENVRYAEAYERSQANLKKMLPLAEELQIIIAVEFVWNNFLLSPMEFARYVDEFNSPWLKAYFDTGNVVAYGWAQDWIRTLGKRIVKIHLKDFKKKERQFVNLRDGDVNWPEVRKALGEVGYEGFLTPELDAGDEAYLKDLSGRIDMIIAGK